MPEQGTDVRVGHVTDILKIMEDGLQHISNEAPQVISYVIILGECIEELEAVFEDMKKGYKK